MNGLLGTLGLRRYDLWASDVSAHVWARVLRPCLKILRIGRMPTSLTMRKRSAPRHVCLGEFFLDDGAGGVT
jgi:hypothetical protein